MLLDVKKENHVCTININRPEKRNAFNKDLFDEIYNVFTELNSDFDIYVVVIRGTEFQGKKFFSGGIDFMELAMLQNSPLNDIHNHAKELQKSFTAIELCNKPVIAVLEGFCLGAGLELALACDLRISTPDCKIGFPETELGIIPDLGGTTRATRVLGTGKAKEMILLADQYSGEQAFTFGLVNFVSDQIDKMISDIVSKLLQRGPIALSRAKKVIDTVYPLDISTALDIERLAQLEIIPSNDVKEGFLARMEKRAPVFKNN